MAAASSFADGDGTAAGARLLGFAVLVVLACALLVIAGIALFGRASDGEPVVQIELVHEHKAVAARPKPAARAAAIANSAVPAPTSAVPPQTELAVTAPSPAPPLPPVTKPVLASRVIVADPALIEETPQGPLPRIADDGRMAMNVYAPPVRPTQSPRIAVVVSGLGLSAKATDAAIHNLPPEVTLAFAPYETDVQRWVTAARGAGHEVLLELPMEPYDSPDSDPGPHTLRAAVSEESNNERLVWSLTRFTGYAGVTNLLGGRLLSDADSLEPIMTFLTRRGLMFFDSGPQNRSVASDVARSVAAPYVQSAMTLDTIQTGMEIDARLGALEKLARTNGSAAGTGFVYPVTIDRIANWARGLESRGFVLVPASAIVAAPK